MGRGHEPTRRDGYGTVPCCNFRPHSSSCSKRLIAVRYEGFPSNTVRRVFLEESVSVGGHLHRYNKTSRPVSVEEQSLRLSSRGSGTILSALMTSESTVTAVHGQHQGHSENPPIEAPAEKRLTSRYRGVCWNRKNKRWQAAINRAGRYIYLGSFRSEYDAARAFDRAAVRLKGSQAKLNFNFADYHEDMNWHNQLSAMGDTTQIVLENPKLLREGLQGAPANQGMMPIVVPCEMPHFPMQSTGPIGRSPQRFNGVTWTEQPIPGRVIGHVQEQQKVISSAQCGSRAASMYPYYVQQQQGSMPYEKQPITSSLFSPDGNGMLPPVCGQYSSVTPFSFSLREPVIKAEPQTTQPLTPGDKLLPVVNLPDGAELVNVFRGTGDAFASVFVRKNSTVAEVLLYDGRAMHEVGAFSSKGDAAQTCQSLLKILNSVKSDDERQHELLVTPAPCTPCSAQPVRNLESRAIHRALDDDSEVPTCDRPIGKSPFEVEPGKRPSFGSDKAEEICAYAKEEMTCPEAECNAQSSAPGELIQDSLVKRMGSLLCVSKGSLEEQNPSIASVKTVKDCKNEVGTQVYSSLSLINSGSLKNLLAVFNQSGNFSILKREEDDEDEQGNPMHMMLPQVSFAPYDEPLGVSTPRLGSPERTVQAFGPVPSHAEDSVDYISDMPDDNGGMIFGKRKFLGEMEGEPSKKRRDGPMGECLY